MLPPSPIQAKLRAVASLTYHIHRIAHYKHRRLICMVSIVSLVYFVVLYVMWSCVYKCTSEKEEKGMYKNPL
jgi:hypothetical protein